MPGGWRSIFSTQTCERMSKPVLWKADAQAAWQAIPLAQLSHALLHPRSEWLQAMRPFQEGQVLSYAQKTNMQAALPWWMPALFHPAHPKKEHYLLQHYVVAMLRPAEDTDRLWLYEAIRASRQPPVLLYAYPPAHYLALVFRLASPISNAGQAALLGYVLACETARSIEQDESICLPPLPPYLPLPLMPGMPIHYDEQAPAILPEHYLQGIDRQVVELVQHLSRHEYKRQAVPPSKTTVRHIKQRLGLPVRGQRKKRTHIMEPLRKVLPFIEEELRQHGIEIESTAGIRYGMKIKVRAGQQRHAALNVYYSNYGYSVLGSPQSSQNEGLMTEARRIIEGIIEYLNYLKQLEDEQ